jgi:uncharacterized protein DUF1844
MLREKTRGNLTAQEAEILSSVLSDLEIAYVQASAASSSAPAGSSTPPPEEVKPAADASDESASQAESKKKFSKSYGA